MTIHKFSVIITQPPKTFEEEEKLTEALRIEIGEDCTLLKLRNSWHVQFEREGTDYHSVVKKAHDQVNKVLDDL